MLALFRLGVNRNVCDFSTFDFSALFYQWRCLIVTLRAFRDFLIFTLSIQTDVTWIYSHITLVRTRKVRAWPAALWFWPIVYSSSTRITPVYRDIAYLLLKSYLYSLSTYLLRQWWWYICCLCLGQHSTVSWSIHHNGVPPRYCPRHDRSYCLLHPPGSLKKHKQESNVYKSLQDIQTP